VTFALAQKPKAYRGLGMEGIIARWYAKNTLGMLAQFKSEAKRIAGNLHAGDRVLEIAPGPGYLAIELAKLGAFTITGIDISHSFVEMAAANAARAGVCIEFRQGNAAALPFWESSFELVVCRAAFKNFSDPLAAIREMHRVLAPAGTALIIDLRNDASDEAIDGAVDEMHVGWLDRFMSRAIFKHCLRSRAYSRADFIEMAKAAPFADCDILESAIGFEVRLTK
jgi:ubiquinone/menaquinone biosynthesis C-methylase UbiE